MQSLQKLKFPDGFLLSVNEKHNSNTNELLKIIQKIIISYLEKTQKDEELTNNYRALISLDVFRG